MDLVEINEAMVKNFKLMQEQINDLNSRICSLAEEMHSESTESITTVDAQTFYTAMMTDTLLEEGEEDEQDVFQD